MWRTIRNVIGRGGGEGRARAKYILKKYSCKAKSSGKKYARQVTLNNIDFLKFNAKEIITRKILIHAALKNPLLSSSVFGLRFLDTQQKSTGLHLNKPLYSYHATFPLI